MTAQATAEREAAPMAGARLTTGFQATEVKISAVEKGNESLTAKVTLTIANLDPAQLYELGNIIEAGPLQVTLRSCQLGLGL